MTYEEMIQGALGSLERIRAEVERFGRTGENGASRQYVAAIHDYLVDVPTFEEWWDGPAPTPYMVSPESAATEAR